MACTVSRVLCCRWKSPVHQWHRRRRRHFRTSGGWFPQIFLWTPPPEKKNVVKVLLFSFSFTFLATTTVPFQCGGPTDRVDGLRCCQASQGPFEGRLLRRQVAKALCHDLAVPQKQKGHCAMLSPSKCRNKRACQSIYIFIRHEKSIQNLLQHSIKIAVQDERL